VKGDQQKTVTDAVRKVYRIDKDDANMRGILETAADKRGEFFDSLRKNYPVRREFQNTKIIIEDSKSDLAEKLSGVGFRVENEE
jgi:erythronate-4-phosphate dehydrogenase